MNLDTYLKLNRCPHCSVDNPSLVTVKEEFKTGSDDGSNVRIWRAYRCGRCGGVVTAYCNTRTRDVQSWFPSAKQVDESLPAKVKAFLQQAIDSTFAPSGSVMLCASAVDAMLKEKGYTQGSLYSRINKAIEDHLLTQEMGTWAHQVRLDANDERHADENADLPTVDDAKKVIEFASTLAEFLFVLPSKVTRGIQSTTPTQ